MNQVSEEITDSVSETLASRVAETPVFALKWRIQKTIAAVENCYMDKGSLKAFDPDRYSELREATGITQVQLARLMKMSSGTVENLEAGTTAPLQTIILYLRSLLSAVESIHAIPGRMPQWLRLPGEQSRGDLLNPFNRVVFYEGNEVDDLVSWCRKASPLLFRSVRSVAGTGQTRVGIELCDKLRKGNFPQQIPSGPEAEEWLAGFMSPKHLADDSPWKALDVQGHSMLVIFDGGAQKHEMTALRKFIPFILHAPVKRLRILIFGSSHRWYNELRLDDECDSVFQREEFQKVFERSDREQLIDEPSRENEFIRAAKAFLGHMQTTGEYDNPKYFLPRSLGRILTLHMLALIAVSKGRPRKFHREEHVLDEALHRERRRWWKEFESRRLEPTLFPLLERSFWQINYLGGSDSVAKAVRQCSKIRAFAALSYDVKELLLDILHACYHDEEFYIPPLRPEKLSLYFITTAPSLRNGGEVDA